MRTVALCAVLLSLVIPSGSFVIPSASEGSALPDVRIPHGVYPEGVQIPHFVRDDKQGVRDDKRGVWNDRLTIARLQYDGGGDWYANPSSLPNLLEAIRQRTSLKVEKTEARVRLTDERLWDFPFLHVTGHGNIRLTEVEVERLREYLLRGGFLHVSDNYGIDSSFRREIARVFPDRPLVDVPLTHPVYHIVYDFPKGLPKIHEHNGKPARGFGIFIGDRLAVFYDYECDLGNGWENPEVYHDPPELHEAALRMGVNLFTYAVTSRPLP